MSVRGNVKEFTRDTERRLRNRLLAFARSVGTGRALWVTLTTNEQDPMRAKMLLRRWTARVRHAFEIHGVYCLEFNERQIVHYHLVLALHSGAVSTPLAVLRHEFWKAWASLGNHDAKAFKVLPASLRDPAWLIRYMTKADSENGEPHHKRWQKRLPVAFAARGTGAHWWGVIGRRIGPHGGVAGQQNRNVDEVAA